MLINFLTKTIYCFECHRDYSLDPFEVYINVMGEGSITCPNDHIIGYEWDNEWRRLFYLCEYIKEYHSESYCKCNWELCHYEGNNYHCEYQLAKNCYESDLEE